MGYDEIGDYSSDLIKIQVRQGDNVFEIENPAYVRDDVPF